jgi:hypothetical protein
MSDSEEVKREIQEVRDRAEAAKKTAKETAKDADRAIVNNHFLQLNKRVMQEWRALVRKSPVATELMYIFLEHMNNDNAVVCSYNVLVELTGASRATVGRAISLLKKGNWVQAIKIGGCAAFVVNEKVAWQTYANKRQYAIFRATIIASASENEEEVKNQSTRQIHRPPILMENEIPMMRDERLEPPDQHEMEISLWYH